MKRAVRRHQAFTHMMRRLTEDRNQHYEDLSCPCYQPGYGMAKFKEQPCHCSNPYCCGNPRKQKKSKIENLTLQERKQHVAGKYSE
jgi:hypothetical protein